MNIYWRSCLENFLFILVETDAIDIGWLNALNDFFVGGRAAPIRICGVFLPDEIPLSLLLLLHHYLLTMMIKEWIVVFTAIFFKN